MQININSKTHMSYSLNSLTGVIQGLYRVPIMGLIKGDTFGGDYGSYAILMHSYSRSW